MTEPEAPERPVSHHEALAPPDRNRRLRNIGLMFGGFMFVLVGVLIFQAVRGAIKDREAILHSALDQGFWIARSLELGHSFMREEQRIAMRNLLREIARHKEVVSLVLVNEDQTVLIASDAALEGTRWPEALDTPEEHGQVIRSDLRITTMAYAAHFAETSERMTGTAHSHHNRPIDRAKWVIVSLNTATGYAHYKSSVAQSFLVLALTAVLAIAAFVVLGLFQRHLRLEQIKLGLQRFVPRSAQKLIEDDPDRPRFEKTERNATIMFLDIERYTRMSEEIPADVLNRLVEKYFSAFLDIILSHGGEINETAGDGIMAIFTGKTPGAHALSAVTAAVAIREQAGVLNHGRDADEPEILVNVGINTGDVLIGATTIKGATGEHLTYTASGTLTNIAARLCDLGEKGEICLGVATADLVGEHVALSGPQMMRFKNVRDPVSVYRVR